MIEEFTKLIKKTIKQETKTNQTKKIIQVKTKEREYVKLEGLSF
jgi:hypothetical protein